MREMNTGSGSSNRGKPDPRFDDPRVLAEVLLGRVLPLVSQPARYIGGELGTVREGFDAATKI